MYSTSGAFKTAIAGDHTVIAKAEVWNADRKLIDLDIDDGKVSVNFRNVSRRTCEIHLVTTRDA